MSERNIDDTQLTISKDNRPKLVEYLIKEHIPYLKEAIDYVTKNHPGSKSVIEARIMGSYVHGIITRLEAMQEDITDILTQLVEGN